MASSSELRRGALGGLASGLLASTLGFGYLTELSSWAPDDYYLREGISWPRIVTVFVVQLAVSGALAGALLHESRAALERRSEGEPGLARSMATAVVAALAVAVPSGAFGAAYFGSIHAAYMGNGVILALPAVLAIGLSSWVAWLRNESAPLARRAITSLGASIACLLPFAIVLGALASRTTDGDALDVMHTVPLPFVGAEAGAFFGTLLGVHSALVVALSRKLSKSAPPSRVRIAIESANAPAIEAESYEDPLAADEAALEARFAELDRLERARR